LTLKDVLQPEVDSESIQIDTESFVGINHIIR